MKKIQNLQVKLNYLLVFINECDEEFVILVQEEIDRLKAIL